jgi:hypothetical protein
VNHHAKQTTHAKHWQLPAEHQAPDEHEPDAELTALEGRETTLAAGRVAGEGQQLTMTLRPFKKYKLLVAALSRIIEQHESLSASKDEMISLNNQIIESQAATITAQAARITALEKRSAEAPQIPLPTVEAVEGLVAGFFQYESIGIAKQAIELTRNLAPLGPDDMKATTKCLMKFWKHYAMKKVEHAANQDVV